MNDSFVELVENSLVGDLSPTTRLDINKVITQPPTETTKHTRTLDKNGYPLIFLSGKIISFYILKAEKFGKFIEFKFFQGRPQ